MACFCSNITPIKLHKENHSIRPLINFKAVPSYSLAKFLDYFIKQKLVTYTDYSVKNTPHDFIEKINNISIVPGYKMISLDIKNLYASIPKIEALNIPKEKHTNTNRLNTNEVQELILFVHFIICQNYFQHNENFYSKNDGLVMGGPFSVICDQNRIFKNTNVIAY